MINNHDYAIEYDVSSSPTDFNGTQAVTSVTRETRHHNVHLDFFLDIPLDHQ